MYREPRLIDNGEAMEHNRLVEQAREAEHLRRCAESPAYRRVYEQWQQAKAHMQSEQAKVANAMHEAMQQQRVSDIVGHCDVQTIRIGRPEPFPPPAELEQAAVASPLSALIYASMFMTKEQWEQIPENVKAMQEMRQVDEEYDRQVIRMSGFEW